MTEIKTIPISMIVRAKVQPRRSLSREKLAELADSVKEKGLIQPIIVRESDGKYEIIAGERRWRAVQEAGKTEIPAVILKAGDIEAREISLIENWHRENLSDTDSDKFTYDLWKDGKYKSYSEMSRRTGISEDTIRNVVLAGKEKDSERSEVIKGATTSDLYEVRPLAKVSPKAREELLKSRIEKPERLTRDKMRSVAKAIVEAPEDKRVEVAKMVAEEKLEPQKAESFVRVLKESPQDIQEKLIKQEITPEEAEEVKVFKQPAQREQVLKERKMLREEAEEDIKRFKEQRIKQAEALDRGEDVREHLTRLVPGEVDHSEIILKRYQDTYFKVMSFRADHIKQIEDAKVRKACIDYCPVNARG